MNRYRVTYTALDLTPKGRVIHAVDEAGALRLFHAPFQFCHVDVTVHEIKHFSTGTMEQTFQRYTRNLRKLDDERYGEVLETIADYWSAEAWSKLSSVLFGAISFCDDSRVRRDMTALMLFSNRQDAFSNPLHTD